MRYLLIFGIIACNAPKGYGSIEGNVYVSSRILNKADAGATIDLYKENDSVPIQTAMANVNGDYKFDKVESGNYYLVFKSNSPVSDPRTLLLMFYAYSELLKKIDSNFPSDDVDQKYEYYSRIYQNLYNLDSIYKVTTDYIESLPKTSLDKVGYKIQGYNY